MIQTTTALVLANLITQLSTADGSFKTVEIYSGLPENGKDLPIKTPALLIAYTGSQTKRVTNTTSEQVYEFGHKYSLLILMDNKRDLKVGQTSIEPLVDAVLLKIMDDVRIEINEVSLISATKEMFVYAVKITVEEINGNVTEKVSGGK